MIDKTEIDALIKRLHEGTMGLPSGLELEAAEILKRIRKGERTSQTAFQL